MDANGEILPGTLEMLILKTVATHGRLNGAEIATSVLKVSDGVLGVKEGALYPALHRLEVRGSVESEPGFSKSKRRAKFYRLTAVGMKELEEQQVRWGRLTSAIGKIMEKL